MLLRRRSTPGPARRSALLLTLLALLALAALPPRTLALERASLVRDITPGPASTFFESFGVLGDTLLFTASGPEGLELWRSDGTAAGTSIVKDIAADGSSIPSAGVPFQGRLYFTAIQSPQGFNLGPRSLWRTDGTAAGTALVKDFAGLTASELVLANGALFLSVRPFSGRDPYTLWRSDGTDAGTAPLEAGPVAFTNPQSLVGATSQLFFTAVDSAGFRNLFRSDGTAAGTAQLTRLQRSNVTFFQPTAVGDRLFVSFDDGVHGVELWTSDGTAAGTRLVKDLNPGPGSSFTGDLAPFGGRLAFGASGVGGPAGTGLLITDGTEAGTQVLFEDPAGPSALTVIDGRLYFDSANRLFVSDGTAAGTRLLLDLATLAPPAFNVAGIFAFNDTIYFIAQDGAPSEQIWRTDGSAAGTRAVTPIVAAEGEGSGVFGPTAVGDALFFFAAEAASGIELWKLVDDPDGEPPVRATGGLLALYTFAEGAGATVRDRSGVAPALDVELRRSQGATWVDSGLRLNGSNGLYSSGPASKITSAAQASEEVTIEAWVTPLEVEQFSARIVTISSSPTRRNVALIQGVFDTQQSTVVSGRIRVDPDFPTGGRPLLSPAGSLRPRLTHLIFTRSSDGTERLYVDGVEVASDVRSGSLSSWDPSYPLALGGEVPSRRSWSGTFHLVAIYGRALSAAEVGQNFAFGPFVR